MTLGERLRELRQRSGLSQDEVAQKLFLSRQSVSKWENDGAEPGVENLKALSRLYGVTIDELVDNAPETKQEDQLQPYDMFQIAVMVRVLTALYGMALIGEGMLLYCWDVPLLLAGHRFRNQFVWGAILTLGSMDLFIHLTIAMKLFWHYYDNDPWENPFHFLIVTAGIALTLVLLLQKKTRAYFTRKD